MMTPVHNTWAVTATAVRADRPVALTPTKRRKLRSELIRQAEIDGDVTLDAATALSILDAADPSSPPVVDYEATITDETRGVTYRARLNATGDLSRLEVVLEGTWIDDNALRRVPIGRIRREALAHIAAAQRADLDGSGDIVVLTLPGGLAERPTLDVIGDIMADGRTRAEIHALYPSVPLSTIGRWMGQVRRTVQTPGAARHRASERKSHE